MKHCFGDLDKTLLDKTALDERTWNPEDDWPDDKQETAWATWRNFWDGE
jgi:hypothetical protein